MKIVFVDWSQVDEYGNRLTRTKYLSNQDLINEQKKLVKKHQKNITFRQKTVKRNKNG